LARTLSQQDIGKDADVLARCNAPFVAVALQQQQSARCLLDEFGKK